nr:Fic family protein [Cellulosimicrobium sp. MM]
MAFVRREDLPVLVQTAVAHAQLETIHPFTDGNGAPAGPSCTPCCARRASPETIAPVSAGLLIDTEAYFDALTAFRAGDAWPIVEQLSRASRFARRPERGSSTTSGQVATAREQLSGLRPQASAWSVVPHLVAHPVINAAFLRDHLGFSDVTAQRALSQLADAGVLRERSGLRRNRVWQHEGILAVLDLFAQRIRRS